MKKHIVKLLQWIQTTRYYIGFIDLSYDEIDDFSPKKIKWLDEGRYKDGWFADPFILSNNGRFVELLVEEFIYSNSKGRISLLKIELSGDVYKLKKITPVLSLPTHLSFPYIIKDRDKIYVVPENFQAGAVSIYEYNPLKLKLINPVKIINEPLVDTQIVKISDYYYAFGVYTVTGSMNETKRLRIFRSNTLLGEYEYVSEIINTQCLERGAGEIVRLADGTYLRPVQNCETVYGGSTIINRLIFCDNTVIKEEKIAELSPDHNSKRGDSLHTINYQNGLMVIDGSGYKNFHFLNKQLSPVVEKFLSLYYKISR